MPTDKKEEANTEERPRRCRGEAGREFVEAYVEFIHYVERLHLDATTPAAHGEGAPAAEHEH